MEAVHGDRLLGRTRQGVEALRGGKNALHHGRIDADALEVAEADLAEGAIELARQRLVAGAGEIDDWQAFVHRRHHSIIARMLRPRAKTSLHLRLDFGGERSLGPGKVRLLELIDATGSISAAGRALKMSYRQAWLLIDELNRMFREPLVTSQIGGGGGGGAPLTKAGASVIRHYRGMERRAPRPSSPPNRPPQRPRPPQPALAPPGHPP